MSASKIFSFSLPLLALGTVLVSVASVEAQGRGQGRSGFGSDPGLRLLTSEQVQRELDLVDEQIEQIDQLQLRQRNEMREMFKGMRDKFRNMDRDGREDAMNNIREQMSSLNEKFAGEASEILLPHQVTRWEQLKFQSQARLAGGADRFIASDTVAKKLNITEEQMAAMKAKAEEIRASVQEKIAKIRAEAQDELLSVLTPEQQEQYKSLTGDAFAFEEGTQRGWGGRAGRTGDRGGRGEGGRRGGQGQDAPGGRRGDRDRPPAEDEGV